jgi:hypothetical protein
MQKNSHRLGKRYLSRITALLIQKRPPVVTVLKAAKKPENVQTDMKKPEDFPF